MDGMIESLTKVVKWFFSRNGLFAQLFTRSRLFCTQKNRTATTNETAAQTRLTALR